MGDFQYFDVILFAMIAGFLVLRLRSVLGRRTGNERRRDNLFGRTGPGPEKIEPIAERSQTAAVAVLGAKPADPIAQGIERIRRADPSFDPAQFSRGCASRLRDDRLQFCRR